MQIVVDALEVWFIKDRIVGARGEVFVKRFNGGVQQQGLLAGSNDLVEGGGQGAAGDRQG